MGNIEFRRNGSYYEDRQHMPPNQLALPLLFRQPREVYWIHGFSEIKRCVFMGNRAITRIVMQEGVDLPKKTYIDTDTISELKDPELRYALRFADAASAVGQMPTGRFSGSSQNVSVIATDEGVESKLIDAEYSGVSRNGIDSFMENLQSAKRSGSDE